MKPNILHSSQSVEWYTPQKYIDSVKKVLGQIDLDPASNEEVNKSIKAHSFFSEQEDGYIKRWFGSVWMNPPYGFRNGISNQQLWTEKLINEYEQKNVKEAICLVNASTDTKWFQKLWRYPICFTDHRIKFIPAGGNKNQPTHGSVFVYFGKNFENFRKEFGQYGVIVRPSILYSEAVDV